MKQNETINAGVNQEEYNMIFELNRKDSDIFIAKESLISKLRQKISNIHKTKNDKIFSDIAERETKFTK